MRTQKKYAYCPFLTMRSKVGPVECIGSSCQVWDVDNECCSLRKLD